MMQVRSVPLSSLKEYENNAKVHDEANIDAIKASIERFGNCDPIGVWTNAQGELVIVEGHGRKMALEALGYDTAEVIMLDHLTDEERRAYTLAHNQTTLMSDFDLDALELELDALADFGMDDFGFDVGAEDEEPVEVVEDDVPEGAPALCKVGDIWQLGRHRLMCGDSTDAEAVGRLMNGSRADVCFTSPPYNAMRGFSANDKMNDAYMKTGGCYTEYPDNLSEREYSEFLTKALDTALMFSDDALFNIGYTKGALVGTAMFLGDNATRFGGGISWVKSNAFVPAFPVQHGIMTNVSEPIYFFNSKGLRKFSHPQWDRSTSLKNIIETENGCKNEYSQTHGATFPVTLASEVIRNFTESSVLDLFGGTGTTIIAAEQLDRTCYMMELDPQYCDVVIERWQNLTGETARKVS